MSGGAQEELELNVAERSGVESVGGVWCLTDDDLREAAALPEIVALDPVPTGAHWISDVDAAGVRCVAHGVDTLVLSIYTEIAARHVAQLMALRDLAREQEAPVLLCLGSTVYQVTWARPPFALALKSAAVTLSVARAVGPDAPQVYAEIHPPALWQDGPAECVEALLAALRRIEVPRREATRATVSRIDLAADFVGLRIEGSDLTGAASNVIKGELEVLAHQLEALPDSAQRDALGATLVRLMAEAHGGGRWVTRAQHRGLWFEGGRIREEGDAKAKRRARARAAEREQRVADQGDAYYQRGRKHTGGAFGTGDVRVRYYDKTLEIEKAGPYGKVWMHGIWAAHGWNGRDQVWRIEAQLRGPMLRYVLGVSADAGTDPRGGAGWSAGAVGVGHAWPVVRRNLDALWRRIVGDPDEAAHGWITLRDRTVATQPTRWPISAQWRAVQAVSFADVAELPESRRVYVARIQTEPTVRHRVEALAKWNPARVGREVLAATRRARAEGDAETLAQLLVAPDAVAPWADGPATQADAGRLALVMAQHMGCDIDIQSAEARAGAMAAQVLGCGASWAVAAQIARGDVFDPEEGLEYLRAQLENVNRDEWAAKCLAARNRNSLTGAVGYRVAVLQSAEGIGA